VTRKRLIVCEILILAMLVLIIPPATVFCHDIANHQDTHDRYISASDVIIISDNDWISQAWPGNGTIESPYIIDGINEDYVKISNSTKWFVIQFSMVHELIQFINVTNGRIEFSIFRSLSVYQSTNVTIVGNTQDVISLDFDSCNHILIANNSLNGVGVRYDGDKGITTSFSCDVRFLNNTIGDFYTGIDIVNSSDCYIQKNYITMCGIYTAVTPTQPPVPLNERAFSLSQSEFATIEGGGIRLENCTNSKITNNTIEENEGSNIFVGTSTDILIYDNSMTKNRKGMILQECTSFNITSNLIDLGLTLYSCLSGVVTHNRLLYNGLLLEGALECLVHSISNNTVDESPIIYLANVNSYAMVSSTVAQVIIINCTQVILQDVATENTLGVQVMFSEACRFRYVSSGYFLIRGCYDVMLEDSRIYGWSGYGVAIDSSLTVFILENYISCGILVRNYSNKVFVRNNTQSGARSSAIRVESDSSEVFIERNDIRMCGRNSEYYWYYSYYPAILVMGTDGSITENTVVDNYGIGIALHGSNITVCYNIIARNGQGNALDHGSGNFWDDGESRGNTWGDYIGFGYYYIPGSAGSIDRYPSLSSEFMEPYVIITWAVIIGTPLTLIILVGILIILRRRNRIQANKPVQIKRVGLG